MHEMRAFFPALNRCAVRFGVVAAIVLFALPLFSAESQQDGKAQADSVSGRSVLLKSQNEVQQAVWDPSGRDAPSPSLVLPPERVQDSLPVRSSARVSANAERPETDGKGRSARVSRKKQVRDSLRVASVKQAEVLKQMKRAAEKKLLDSLETAARSLRTQDSLRRESAMVRYRDSVRLVLAHERTVDSLHALRMKRDRSSAVNRSARRKQQRDTLVPSATIAGGAGEKPRLELVAPPPSPGRISADSVSQKSGPASGQSVSGTSLLRPVPQQGAVSRASSGRDSLFAEALLHYRQGSFGRALPLANQALLLSRKMWGLNSSAELPSLVLIADIYLAEKKYRQAMPFYLRALAISEKMPAQNYSVTAGILHSLGSLYADEGSEARADEYFRKALAIREKTEGPEGEGVAGTLAAMGALYNRQGKSDIAMMYYTRALSILEKLDDTGASSAPILLYMAALYHQTGYYDLAVQLFQRALMINERVKGRLHPDVAVSLNGLAMISLMQQRYTESELLFQRGLDIQEKAFGPEHAEVALTLQSLASVKRLLQRFDDAERLMRRSLAITGKRFPPGHRNVGAALNSLALIYDAKGDYAAAEPLFRKSLAVSEKRVGGNEADAAQVLENMSNMYLKSGRQKEAEQYAKRAMRLRNLIGERSDEGGAVFRKK